MFDDSTVYILGNNPENSWQKTIVADVQSYSETILIGEYKFNINKRFFTDYIEPLLNIESYVEIESKIFKILNIIEYSDYQEVWIYLLDIQR